MDLFGEHWWVTLLCYVAIAIAGCVYTWKIRSLRDACDIGRKRIDSLQETLSARDQEIDRLQQENTRLKKTVDDGCGSPTMMVLPPTVVNNYHHKVISAEVTVPFDVSDKFSAEDIEDALMRQLAPEIRKCWSVETGNDIVQFVKRSRATLHVLLR